MAGVEWEWKTQNWRLSVTQQMALWRSLGGILPTLWTRLEVTLLFLITVVCLRLLVFDTLLTGNIGCASTTRYQFSHGWQSPCCQFLYLFLTHNYIMLINTQTSWPLSIVGCWLLVDCCLANQQLAFNRLKALYENLILYLFYWTDLSLRLLDSQKLNDHLSLL